MCVSGPSESRGHGSGWSSGGVRRSRRSAAPRTARDRGATEAEVRRKGGLFRLRALSSGGNAHSPSRCGSVEDRARTICGPAVRVTWLRERCSNKAVEAQGTPAKHEDGTSDHERQPRLMTRIGHGVDVDGDIPLRRRIEPKRHGRNNLAHRHSAGERAVTRGCVTAHCPARAFRYR